VQKAARDKLLEGSDLAIDALLRALKTGQPCELCGRSDSDRDPVVIRAAQVVLDRTGFGPSVTVVEQPPAENPNADLTPDEMVERCERMLEHAKRLRDQSRLQLSDGAEDGSIVDESAVEIDVPSNPTQSVTDVIDQVEKRTEDEEPSK
jgi:hypothetical protein